MLLFIIWFQFQRFDFLNMFFLSNLINLILNNKLISNSLFPFVNSVIGFDTFSFDPHSFATKHLVNGFKECADQVTRFLSSEMFALSDQNLKVRLISHLQHYITKREYDLKAYTSNGISWNPNLFLIPPTTTAASQSTPSSNGTNSLVNTTAQQMLNSTTNLSPIATLTPSSLSSHSNSSITSNSSSYHQQINQQNDSTPTSPLSESPVANSSLNGNSLNVSSLNGNSLNGSSLNTSQQLTASQLLSQHSYTDNNNNTSNSSSIAAAAALHSDSANSSASQSSSAINDDGGRNSLLSNIMGPPPPLLQKVNVLNGISPHSPNSTAELTYTNMHPSPNANAYSTHHHHHHHSIATNGYSANPYAAAIAAQHSNHIHHHTPYNAYSALAYGTSVGPMSASASMVANVVSLPNSSVGQSTANQPYSNAAKPPYCRPWGTAEMAKMAY